MPEAHEDLVEVAQDAVDDAIGGGEDESTDVEVDTGGDDDVDLSDVPDDDEPVGSGASDDDDEPASSTRERDASGKFVAKAGAEDEDDPDLAEVLKQYTGRAPKPGERVNRIPQPRVNTMIVKALRSYNKLVKGKHKLTLEQLNGQLSTSSQAQKTLESLVRSQNPEAALLWLASQNEGYKRFVGGQQPPAEQRMPAAEQDPEPQPDHRFEDGSLGYSPETYQKWQQWNRRQAVREAQAETDRKYAPILEPLRRQKELEAQQEAIRPTLQRRMGKAREVWGQLLEEEIAKGTESEIIKLMNAEGNDYMTTDAAIAAVLVPRLMQSEAQIRKKILAEFKQRKRAAAGGSVIASGGQDTSPENETVEQAAFRAVRAAGLIK